MKSIAHYIDHTLLKPSATRDQIQKLCAEAIENKFYSVCVNPYYVNECQNQLWGTGVNICSVIGFPLGANNAKIKLAEATTALDDGADELDMVINIGALLDKDFDAVVGDIKNIVELAHANRALLKVIIETGLLTEEQKVYACELAVYAGADFVKTCTGFNGGQATIEDILLMKARVGDKAQVKASAGIRNLATALAMIEAGASRIGTSSGIEIVLEENDLLLKQ